MAADATHTEPAPPLERGLPTKRLWLSAGPVIWGAVANQGLLAVLLLPVALFSALGAVVKQKRRRRHLIACAALTLGFVLAYGYQQNSDTNAEARFQRVIAAVQAWHARHERYPDNLQALVPDYLDDIPRAKPFLFGEFSYFRHQGPDTEDGATLHYVAIAPFGRRTYNFERGEYGYVD